MQLIENIEQINEPFPNAVISIGNFDGVHIGHQALFQEVIDKARAIHGTAIAMTFEPHPLRVLTDRREPPLITLYEQKMELIEKVGLDVVICVPFTKAFAEMSARAFIEDLLVKRIGMKAAVVGQDYAFGKNREGDLDMLRTMGESLNFDVIISDWVNTAKDAPERISSTRIRNLVTEGQVLEARRMLGRYYQIRGKVIRGRNRGGKLLGFPTANIELQDELCPKTGIYAVSVEWNGQRYPGVANIGYSPTFDDHLFTVEVHIMDFQDNIYGKKIKVNFVKRIRDEMKFPSLEMLSAQIREDVKSARAILDAIDEPAALG